MMLSDIISGVLLMAVFFFLGWTIAFIYRVRLGRFKDKFECTMCGNCCRLKLIAITEEDIKKLESEGLKDFYVKQGKEYFMKRVHGRCLYLKDDKCSIHTIRPQICRKFPFFKFHGISYCRAVSYCPAVEELKKNV